MRKIMKKKRNLSVGFPFFTFLTTFFIILIVAVLAISNFRIYEKRTTLQDHIDEKESELEMLQKRIDQAKTSDGPGEAFMIEKMAREQLLLKKPGEEVVFITFPETEDIKKDEGEKKDFVWWNPFTWRIN